MVTHSLTRAVGEPNNARSLSARARTRRWERFVDAFPEIADMRVLDLGGLPDYWRKAPVRPAHVTTLNLALDSARESWIEHRQGDACAGIAGRYDLVVSNSLLEHVGGHVQRQRLADVVVTAAPRYWVQTPYRYFPIEPHWMFPGLQFLPFPARVAVTKSWPLGHRHATDDLEAEALVAEVDLVGIRQMRSYFPGSQVWIEHWAGLPKSLVAIRSSRS